MLILLLGGDILIPITFLFILFPRESSLLIVSGFTDIIGMAGKAAFGNKGEHAWVHHSTTLLGDPQFKDLQAYIGATAWNLLDGQGFDLSNYTIFITE